MKRRRISPIMIAGVLAILSALGLIALITSGSLKTDIDPTQQQATVNAIVYSRLTETAQARPTLDPLLASATALTAQAAVTDAPSGTVTPNR
ncbi:MAG TPA: hypothetical protein VHD90_19695 [Phototrophicaceae bacterium]|nr:hypothetical protein [Phototrophicaceae bacterium]